ncbi:MAG: outer membrane beta-barrel protein [Bacteroidales bacterium]|nr:outer membrane beta-barrel protein [Bacteroidales bacterium]
MKKLILTLVAITVTSVASFAQVVFTAGYTHDIFTASVKETGFQEKVPGNGAFLKGAYQFPIARNTFLEGGLRLDYVGVKGSRILTEYKETWLYAGIPLMVSAKAPVGSELNIGFSVGPTLNIGLLSEEQVYVNGQKTGDPLNKFDYDGISRFDILVGANLYLELFNQFRINVGYDLGTFNTSKESNLKRRFSRLNIGLSYVLF